MGAGQWRQFEFMAVAERKPYNLAALVEMHPYSRFAGLLLKGSMSLDSQVALLPYESSSFATPEGEVLAALCLEILMSPEAEWRANLPLRGKRRRRRQRGCISNGRSPVGMFSLPDRAGF